MKITIVIRKNHQDNVVQYEVEPEGIVDDAISALNELKTYKLTGNQWHGLDWMGHLLALIKQTEEGTLI